MVATAARGGLAPDRLAHGIEESDVTECGVVSSQRPPVQVQFPPRVLVQSTQTIVGRAQPGHRTFDMDMQP